MRRWSRGEPFPDRLALVVQACNGNKQPANSKQSHDREAAAAAAVTSCGCVAFARTGGLCAFFLASLARRLRSASLLPEATRPAFLAGFVCGGSAVTRAGAGEFGGVGAAVGSSGIVSSGVAAIGYI